VARIGSVIAKRLESEAENGGTLVSEVVPQPLQADRGDVSLKGVEEPVPAWSVEW